MNVQPYSDKHFEGCVSLFHEAYVQTYPHYEGKFLQKERFYAIFNEHVLPRHKVYVLEDGSDLLGFIAVADHFVDQLYIKDYFRGQGLGTWLLNHAKTLYPEQLELYTMAENTRAIHFYEKHGFRIVQYGIAPDEQQPDVLMAWYGK